MDSPNTCQKSYVLIIEDDPGHQKLFEIFVKRAGCRCDCAFDGEVGLQKALQNDYDLIIVDINIPGIDGLEVARRLREAGTKTPAVAVTALQTRELKRQALYAGFDGFFAKPIDHALISNIIEQHLPR